LVVALTNLDKAEADFVRGLRADGAGDFDAVFEKDRGGPEFYSEGAAERAAGAVFDLYVLDGGELGESFADGGGGRLAVAAPRRAEFEEDWAAGCVDFFAGRAGIDVIFRHGAISKKALLGRRGDRDLIRTTTFVMDP
jgi:hypothetical protein